MHIFRFHTSGVGRFARYAALALLSFCIAFGIRMASAQNIEGQIIAAQYGKWRVPGYAPDTYSFAPTACRVEGGASYFQAFSVGVPVKIVDGNPALNEVVVPTAVSENNSGCEITIAPTHHHQPPFYLTSATGGLQEAINANLADPGPNTILLTNRWYELGGSPAIIASVHGSPNLGLEDVTQVPAKWYQWNGSEYAPVNSGGTAEAGTMVNDLISTNRAGALQDLYHFYATGSTYGVPAAVGAAAEYGGTVTVQPGAGHVPFAYPGNANDFGFDDQRMDVQAKPSSFTKFGAQCDAVAAQGTFTAGSNQVANISYPYMGSGGVFTPLADYGDGTAVIAIGWKDPATGQQWVWEPTIESINGTTATLSTSAPANIPTGSAGFVLGHDDTAAFNAVNNYLPLTEVEFPSSIYKGCLTHAFTYNHHSGPILLKGQWSSTIMGYPGEDVMDIASGSSQSLKMEGIKIEVNAQVDARQGYTLIKADGSEQVVPPMWQDGGLKRFWGAGTPWANNPTMPGWQGQTLSAAQASTDSVIPVASPLVALNGDHGYNGVSKYGCVKIPDQNDANSEIECYENFVENDAGPSPVRQLLNVQRGMYQSLGFSAPTTHASGVNLTPVDPVSPQTPFITAGTAYSFESITLQRSGNTVTVTLPATTQVFGVSGAEIEITGPSTGDMAGTFPVTSASGTTVTYNQAGPNEGPLTASNGFAALAGAMRPVVWPAFAEGNAALAIDTPDGLQLQPISLDYSSFESDSFNSYMMANNNGNGTGGIWMQAGMYRVLWDDIQARGSFGFLNVPPYVNTHIGGAFDSETNTFTRFDIHAGQGFVLTGNVDTYIKSLNDYSEEDPNPASGHQLAGIGPSSIPSFDDQTGQISSPAYGNSWDQIYSEPTQYTTQLNSGVYETYYDSFSEFGSGVSHSLNAGTTLIQGNGNTFNGPYWNAYPMVGPTVFILGDDNHGWINTASTIDEMGTNLDQWNRVVMDEGSNNQCWVTNGSATISACHGLALNGGANGDWANRGITTASGVYRNATDLILTAQDLLTAQTGPGQWGNGAHMGFDANQPGNFGYAAQPPSVFASGNIRPYSLGVSTLIGQNYPLIHGTMYIMAKASVATSETYHTYYTGNALTCGAGSPQYLDQSGPAGETFSLTTTWQVFSFGVNLQNAPTHCTFMIGDDTPGNSSAEIDTGWVQFVPDNQYETSSVFATTPGPVLASASTVQLAAGLEHISGTATITNLLPPTPYFTGCVDLIPDGAWQTATGGNIALATTATAGKALRECYDGQKWYPSY